MVKQAPAPVGTGINSCPTIGYIPRTNNGNGNMGCSQIFDDNTNVGIGLGPTAPASKLDINCTSNGSNGHIRLRNLATFTGGPSVQLRTLIIDPATFEVWMGTSLADRQSNTCSLDCGAIDRAIKSQQSQIEEQTIKIENQQAEIAELKNKLNQLVPGNIGVKEDIFTINPNPVTNVSTVTYNIKSETGSAYFAVYDLQGKSVNKYQVTNKQGQIKINKSEFGNGMYILSLVINNVEAQSTKFIISN